MIETAIKLTDEQLKKLQPMRDELNSRTDMSSIIAQVSFHNGGVIHCRVIDEETAVAIGKINGVRPGTTDDRWDGEAR